MEIEKIGAEVRKTIDHAGNTIDKVGEKRIRRIEGFSFKGIEKSVKRIILTAGVATGIALLMQTIGHAIMVHRICKVAEFALTIWSMNMQ